MKNPTPRLTKAMVSPVLAKYKKILGLDGWDLKVAICSAISMNTKIKEFETEESESVALSSTDTDEIVLGCVTHCHPIEQVATVQFRRDATKYFGQWVNLDTLVCHELIHIVVRSEFDRLPKSAQRSKKTGELEEFICDKFSHIIAKAFEEDSK
jgi:hypothetical protein